MRSWPKVPLGEALTRRKDDVFIEPLESYKRLTIRMNGRGVAVRDDAMGHEIGTPHQFRVHAGQLLLSKIDARNGAFGIVPEDCDRAIITGNFWAFDVNPELVDRRYLHFMTLTPEFVDFCVRASEGSTNRLYLQEEKFLAQQVELPPLAEQRRTVARVEELQAKIEQARALRTSSSNDQWKLPILMAHRLDMDAIRKAELGWEPVRLREVLRQVEDVVGVDPEATYPNVGIYSYGRGLFRKMPIEGAKTSAVSLNRIWSGQFIYSRLFAFEGAYGMVSEEFDQSFVSNEYPSFWCDPDRLKVEFIAAYFSAPFVWPAVAAGSKGLGHRRQRVQPEQLLSHRLLLPPLKTQAEIAKVLAELNSIAPVEVGMTAELDGLMPSVLAKAFSGEL